MSSSTRGRPRLFDLDDLVDRSVDVFWRHGLTGATTRTLERELGISQSSLYNSYGSKEELFERAVKRYESRLDAEVVDLLKGGDRHSILAFVAAVTEWVRNDDHRGCMVLNLAAESGEYHHMVRAYRTKLRRRLRPAIASFTDDPIAVESRVELLVAAVLGLNISARSGAGKAELSRMARSIEAQVTAW